MSDIDKKRDWVNGLYPGPKWKVKVRQMSDAQVVAIYLREVNKPPKKPEPEPVPKKKESNPDDLPF